MTKVAVVILNYNGEKLLRQFLPSVIQHSAGAEIFVADNHSSDGSVAILKDEFPSVGIIALEHNYGFCGGYNKALASITSQYYVLLNSDVEVTPGWLAPLETLLDAHPDIAAVQPKILSYARRNFFEYAGGGGGLIDALGYPFCRGRVFDHVEEDRGQYDDERAVFWSSGACMMIRSKSFHEHGGFDEDFFAHMEEIDLCWKLSRSGSDVFYTGRSCVYHLGAGTLGYHHPKKTYLNFRNGLSLIYKHMNPGELFYKLPCRVALDWIAALVFLLKGEGKNFLSVLRAHRDLVRQLGSLQSKRHAIRSRYPRYPKKNMYSGLILLDYYFRKRTTIKLNNPR
jgi:GT2 family glycosyltransferase